jgi:DNA-directed RNA polymerase specialized sigma24 family protein
MARPLEKVTPEQIAAMAPALRRYAEARHVDNGHVDDLVQETVTRLLEVRDRLDVATLFAYALAVLTNLDRSVRRGEDVARRHRHRLLELSAPMSAEDVVIREEQRQAVRQSLDALPADIRQLLLDRYDSDDQPQLSTGAQSARLARARARLRLEYLLALRRVTLPGRRCYPVLLAISERNARRQAEVAAGRHLAVCPVCIDLADPLLRRDARLFVLWPLLATAALARKAYAAHPVVVGGGGVVVAGAVTAAVVLALPDHHHPSPQPSALCRMTGASRDRLLGHRVSVRDVTVTRVPANEGFDVRACSDRTVWIHLRGHGESPVHIRVRDRVTMTGTVRRRGAGVQLVVAYDAVHASTPP